MTPTILVGAIVPEVLAAIAESPNGRKALTTLTDAADIAHRLEDSRPIATMILDDTITQLPAHPQIENTLWELMDLAAMRSERGLIAPRVLLLLREESFPPQIRDHLETFARESGGGAAILPRYAGARERAATVRWLIGQLALGQAHAQSWFISLSGKGGAGKTTQVANLALAFVRRGYQVLMIDGDFANGSLSGFFKIPAGAAEPFLTLREEFPKPQAAYPAESIARRIYTHASGTELLLSGRGVVEVEDLTTPEMRALLAAVTQLPHELVFLDVGPDIKARPIAIDVLRAGGIGLVLCPPGREERNGAENVLRVLSQLTAPGRNASMLTQAAILFVEAERDSVADVHQVRRDMLRQYSDALDLGVMPRNARLISQIAERLDFCSVYDLEPRGRYCQALEAACEQIVTQMRIPAPTGQLRGASILTTDLDQERRGGWLSFLGIRRSPLPATRKEASWR